MYTLAIEDTVEVPLKFNIKSGKVQRLFSFSVTCTRLEQDVITERLDDKDRKVKDFMEGLVTGWEGQKLVVNADGTPADFNPESLAALLNVAGVAGALFNAYFKECGLKEKN